jgi:hypothetical protein
VALAISFVADIVIDVVTRSSQPRSSENERTPSIECVRRIGSIRSNAAYGGPFDTETWYTSF